MTKSVGTSYPFSSNNARSYQVPHVSNTSGNEYISPSNLPGSTIKLSTSLSPPSSSISFTHSDRFISCPSSTIWVSLDPAPSIYTTSGGLSATHRERISSFIFGPACSTTVTSVYADSKSAITSFHQESPYPPTKYCISSSPEISPVFFSSSSFASSDEHAVLKPTSKIDIISSTHNRFFTIFLIQNSPLHYD